MCSFNNLLSAISLEQNKETFNKTFNPKYLKESINETYLFSCKAVQNKFRRKEYFLTYLYLLKLQ